MAKAVTFPVGRSAKLPTPPVTSRRLSGVLSVAEQQEFQSNSELIEAAPANIVVADDYGEWLLVQCGTVSKGLDLEF